MLKGLPVFVTVSNYWNNRSQQETMKTTIQAELPPELVAQARAFVEEGWVSDFDHLLAEALRRYLDSHSSELAESFMREDVAWGLTGRE